MENNQKKPKSAKAKAQKEILDVQIVKDAKDVTVEEVISTEIKKFNLADAKIAELKETFKDLEISGVEDKDGYKAVSEEMKRDGVISYSYLHKRLSKMSAIKNAIEGTTEKIKQLVEEAKTNGILSELPPNLCKEAYKSSARLFKML